MNTAETVLIHNKISIAVPTRHRVRKLSCFFQSILNTHKGTVPHITIIHDCPENREEINFTGKLQLPHINVIHNLYKSSLAQLWNQCIINAPTDWVLICNDDATFNPNWIEYLEKQIDSGIFKQINLLNYGGMCIHKSWILDIGWFDENFNGGGYEDVDFQLRISEAGLKNFVDMSHDFVFMNHLKNSSDGQDWAGENNSLYIVDKWGRNDNWNEPSNRKLPEIDWYPKWTKKYEEKFNKKATFISRHLDTNFIGKQIYP